MLRAHVAELQDKSKAQAEQIDELHKQMAELKMQAGGKLFDEDAGAAALVYLVTQSELNLWPIAEAGGIPPLVALVRDGTDMQKIVASRARWHLAIRVDNKIAIAKAGGIPPLVALVRDGTDDQKKDAAEALWALMTMFDGTLAVNDNVVILTAEAGGIPPLVRLMRYGNEAQKERARYALSNFAYAHPIIGNKILIPALSARKEGDIWAWLSGLGYLGKNEYRVALEEAWRCTNTEDCREDAFDYD